MAPHLAIARLNHAALSLLTAMVLITAFPLKMLGEPVDSLYHLYINADRAKKWEITNTISQTLYNDEITDSLYQCDNRTKPARVDAIFHYLMAEHFFNQGDYESTLQESTQARELIAREKVSKLHSDVLGLVSNAHYRLGAIDKSLTTLLEVYQVDKQLGDKKLISSDLNSLAAIYLAVQQPKPGIPFIEKAISLERRLNRPDRLAIRLSLAAELYMTDNQLDKAMAAIDEAYEIDKNNERPDKGATRLAVKAAILERMSKLQEARAILMQALPLLEKSNNIYSLASCYNQLGSVNKKLGNNQDALAFYKKALEKSIKCRSPKIERDAERGMWEMLHDTDPRVAALHLERYTTLSDSMYNQMASAQRMVMSATTQNIEETEINKDSTRWNKPLRWGAAALLALLVMMILGMLLIRRRNRGAMQMMRQTEELRTHFFSNISTKLQAPLTLIMSAGRQLQDAHRASVEENKNIGSIIVNNGNSMLELVNQLIDIEKVKSQGKNPNLRRGDIVMFVRMLIDNYADDAHQRMISLDYAPAFSSLTVDFSPEYIRRIIHGLIANALKFTPRNGSVTVGLAMPDENKVRLSVADTGKGIPAEEISRIFEPMYQTDDDDDGAATSATLSLVNQIVQTLGGNIQVESEQGKGTTFTIDLPLHVVEVSSNELSLMAENLILQTSDDKQKPLVFIVENNEQVAYFIASHLREPYNLRFARDGREALQNAQNLVPDLIITNMTMPVMDGKELIKQLRDDSNLSHIPIIAMTSDTSEKERISCFEAGADNVLVKPFNSSELCILAQHLIRQRSSLRERFVKTSPEVGGNAHMTRISREDKEFINKLVDVIHVQMSKDNIDMEHIAAALSMSRKQLRTRVMNITGLTPVAYVLQVRLNYARRMIAKEDTPLTAIASKCGFQNLSHFSKAFKQQYGVSPMQFRKNNDNISQT